MKSPRRTAAQQAARVAAVNSMREARTTLEEQCESLGMLKSATKAASLQVLQRYLNRARVNAKRRHADAQQDAFDVLTRGRS